MDNWSRIQQFLMSIALADLVDPKQITLNLRAEAQEEAMREIVGLLVAAGKIDNPQEFLDQVRARETTNSTYAADGVAFPHARTNLVDEIVVGIGRSEAGIEWTGRGELAHLIFLIAVPERLISDYLVVVGAIARITKDRPLRTLLIHAENVDDFIAMLLSAPSI
jgi:mannitol/fructose-specific phosphotransferase system IIA component (Ntr-type)